MVQPDSAFTGELHQLFRNGSDQQWSTLPKRYKDRFGKEIKLVKKDLREFIERHTDYSVFTDPNSTGKVWVAKKLAKPAIKAKVDAPTLSQTPKPSHNKVSAKQIQPTTLAQANTLDSVEFALELVTIFLSDVDNRFMTLPDRYQSRFKKPLPLRQKSLRTFIEDNTNYAITGPAHDVVVTRKASPFSTPVTAAVTPPATASAPSPIDSRHVQTGVDQYVADDLDSNSIVEDDAVKSLIAGVRMLDLCSSDEVGSTKSLSLFQKRSAVKDELRSHDLLTSGHAEQLSVGCGLLGERVAASTLDSDFSDTGTAYDEGDAVYLSTEAPFCAICIGVQGAGKSHTMNVMLENCLAAPVVDPTGRPVIQTSQPMAGLVLHFDQSQNSICEAVGLIESNPSLGIPHARVPSMVVLVSPTFYKQRKAFYAGMKVDVHPLLFDWATITATHLRKLMRLCDPDTQLYVSTMLSTLRDYQRDGRLPSFDKFLAETQQKCNANGQSAPLLQRLELLKNFVRQSAKNLALKEVGQGLNEILKPGTLVVADLTDPMMSPDEAAGVFQVLLEQFRSARMPGVGKVVAFDEAHKYLSHSNPGCVELSQAIVDTVRVMRHEGTRILISTQSPTTMPPELLSLTSLTIVHRFQSAEWSKYLSAKVTLPEDSFAQVKALQRGQALVLSSSPLPEDLAGFSGGCRHSMTVNIRPRLTRDFGASRLNKQVQLASEQE